MSETTKPVLAQATVDMIRFSAVPLFEVRVTGIAPDDCERVYQIEAKSDNVAAQEGLRRFVDEMEALREWR
jgi:hypothetical protein